MHFVPTKITKIVATRDVSRAKILCRRSSMPDSTEELTVLAKPPDRLGAPTQQGWKGRGHGNIRSPLLV